MPALSLLTPPIEPRSPSLPDDVAFRLSTAFSDALTLLWLCTDALSSKRPLLVCEGRVEASIFDEVPAFLSNMPPNAPFILRTGVAVLAYISVRSPRKSIISLQDFFGGKNIAHIGYFIL